MTLETFRVAHMLYSSVMKRKLGTLDQRPDPGARAFAAPMHGGFSRSEMKASG
jgi:hypothetical protein